MTDIKHVTAERAEALYWLAERVRWEKLLAALRDDVVEIDAVDDEQAA
jgi:hypothetical protein